MTLPLPEWFTRAGGAFVESPDSLRDRLGRVRAFLLDWDGVFNDGTKGEGVHSTWSEADSMGLNLLRFGWWLRDGRAPPTAILTGQQNPSAVQLANRERFDAVYQGFLDKRTALDHWLERWGLDGTEVAFVFDDALDLAVAGRVGVATLVRRAASPLFEQHALGRAACQYVTALEGGCHAVREVSELFLGLTGLYDRAVAERSAFSAAYGAYFEERQAGTMHRFVRSDGGVREVEP